MRIDLTCPAEIFRTALPREETPALSLTLFNLSDRVIASVEVTARLLTAAGTEKERMAFRGRALNGRPHSTFAMNVPMSVFPGVSSAEVMIEKVWFADNDVWRRNESEETEYEPNALPSSPHLTNLKYVAGEAAVGYPSQQDGLWVCVCGRPNPDSAPFCARCRQEKRTVFERFSGEAVEKAVSLREKQLDLSTRSAREDTARLQRIREEEYIQARARRGRRIRLGLCLALFVLIMAGLTGALLPALKLGEARKTMAAGEYESALDALGEIAGFPGAEAEIRECRWQLAARDAETAETPEALSAAAKLLRESPEKEDSLFLAAVADLRRARILLDSGDFIAARAALEAVDPEDPERIALEADCLFTEALMWVDHGNYSAAREAFLSLDDYPGAADMARECIYQPAVALMRNEQYDEAITELTRILDYRDSRQLALECHYRKAAAFEAEGDLVSAASEYLLAGDWGDAEEKSREMVYLQAESFFRKGELSKAQKLYASIPAYKDADDKNSACLYTLGLSAIHDEEYALAYTLLSGLPEGYIDGDSLRQQAAYEAGRKALKQKDYETARELLAAAGSYSNAARLLKQAEDALAKQETPEDDAAASEPAEPDSVVTAEPTPAPEKTPAPTDTPVPATDSPAPTEPPVSEPPASPAPSERTDETPAGKPQDDTFLIKDGD